MPWCKYWLANPDECYLLQETHYKQLYESEVYAHGQTKDSAHALQAELEKLQQRLTDQQKQHVRESMEAKIEVRQWDRDK